MFSRGSNASLTPISSASSGHQLHQAFGARARHRIGMKRGFGLHYGTNQVWIDVVFRGGLLDDVLVGFACGDDLEVRFDVYLRARSGPRGRVRSPAAQSAPTTSPPQARPCACAAVRAGAVDRSCRGPGCADHRVGDPFHRKLQRCSIAQPSPGVTATPVPMPTRAACHAEGRYGRGEPVRRSDELTPATRETSPAEPPA